MIQETYIVFQIATGPVTRKTPSCHKRNAEIRARYLHGEPLYKVAEVFGISEQHAYQIVHRGRK